MNLDHNRELDESLAYLREKFRPLNQSISIPDSLRADVLRQRLDEKLTDWTPDARSNVVSFPWKKMVGVAACMVVAVGAYLFYGNMGEQLSKSAMPIPMTASVEEIAPDTTVAENETGIPKAVAFDAQIADFADAMPAQPVPRKAKDGGDPLPENGADSGAQASSFGLNPDQTIASIEQAWASEPYGRYLPVTLPTELTGVGGYYTDSDLSLSLFSTDGMEELHITVREMTDSQRRYIADSSKPETWDMNLYPMPWEQNMPEEMYWVIGDVVFLPDDLTLDMVRARLMPMDDQRSYGQFSALYGDVVVYYYFVNLSPEVVYDMVQETAAHA